MRTTNLLSWATCAVALSFLLAPPVAAQGLLTDPVGDTFGLGPVRPDLTSFSAIVLGPNTVFTVNFANPIARPSAGLANSITGFIDLDLDRNPATGIPSHINTTPSVPGPPLALGSEFFVDLFSEEFQPGLVDVVNASSSAPAFRAPITYNPTGFSVSVPLVGSGNGILNYGLLVGTFAEPTDRAPNGAIALQSVPEPSSSVLLSAALVGLLGYRWCRRRRAA